MTARSALVVDDDVDMCWVIRITLELSGYEVSSAHNASDALARSRTGRFAVAFIDVRLPDMDGLKLAELLAKIDRAMRIIIISGYYMQEDSTILESVRQLGIHGFLAKPFHLEAIEAALA